MSNLEFIDFKRYTKNNTVLVTEWIENWLNTFFILIENSMN